MLGDTQRQHYPSLNDNQMVAIGSSTDPVELDIEAAPHRPGPANSRRHEFMAKAKAVPQAQANVQGSGFFGQGEGEGSHRESEAE